MAGTETLNEEVDPHIEKKNRELEVEDKMVK